MNSSALEKRQTPAPHPSSGKPARRSARAKSESPGQRPFPRFRHGPRSARRDFDRDRAEDDYICGYYRDRALVLGRGVTSRGAGARLFREAQRAESRPPDAVALQLRRAQHLERADADRLATAARLRHRLGHANSTGNRTSSSPRSATPRRARAISSRRFVSRRRGKLPVLFIVEDNAYGISSPTRKINPLAIDVLQPNDWQHVDGSDVGAVYDAGQRSDRDDLAPAKGPVFFWVKMERLSSHTSSDDHKLYRSAEEIDRPRARRSAHAAGKSARSPTADLRPRITRSSTRKSKSGSDRNSSTPRKREDPSADELELQVTAKLPELDDEVCPPGKYRIGDSINQTLRVGLTKDPRPDHFRRRHRGSQRRRLSPDPETFDRISEAGFQLAAGGIDHSRRGLRPRLLRQAAGLRAAVHRFHRSGLEPARDQSFDSALALVRQLEMSGGDLRAVRRLSSRRQPLAQPGERSARSRIIPGINVVIPSTPEDAAGLLWTAMHCEDPTIVLIPKHLLWAEHESAEPIRAVPLGKARKRIRPAPTSRSSPGATRWKNRSRRWRKLGDEASVELIDLRSIAPWDREAIEESVRKTGRLVVVQEDTENCSVGQMIISHVAGTAGNLGRDDQPADPGQQRQRHDRLQPDLRIRRAARCGANR